MTQPTPARYPGPLVVPAVPAYVVAADLVDALAGLGFDVDRIDKILVHPGHLDVSVDAGIDDEEDGYPRRHLVVVPILRDRPTVHSDPLPTVPAGMPAVPPHGSMGAPVATSSTATGTGTTGRPFTWVDALFPPPLGVSPVPPASPLPFPTAPATSGPATEDATGDVG